jgi:hypothetical protein
MNNGMRILRGELQIPSTAELLADASTLEVPARGHDLAKGTWPAGSPSQRRSCHQPGKRWPTVEW